MSVFTKSVARYFKHAGAGSLLISIIVHVIIGIGATIYVIQTVKPPPKAKFTSGGGNETSAVQHPVKMSNTQPKLETLNKRLSVETPDTAISLPDLPRNNSTIGGPSLGAGLSGLGDSRSAGPGAGAGPTLAGPLMPTFGFREAPKGGTLVGRFYDLKQSRTKKINPDLTRLGPGPLAIAEVNRFTKAGWSNGALQSFFQAPTILYATQIFMPIMQANEAPKAYGVEKEVQPGAWIALYRGRVSPPATGIYRFVGAGDDLMAVRINGNLVLDCGGSMGSDFKTDRPKSPGYDYTYKFSQWNSENRGGFVVGNRMELKAGQFYDIDIVFSEGPGGGFCAMLLFEQEGVTYKKDAKGLPILPIFRVANAKTERAESAPEFMSDGPVWRAMPRPD